MYGSWKIRGVDEAAQLDLAARRCLGWSQGANRIGVTAGKTGIIDFT